MTYPIVGVSISMVRSYTRNHHAIWALLFQVYLKMSKSSSQESTESFGIRDRLGLKKSETCWVVFIMFPSSKTASVPNHISLAKQIPSSKSASVPNHISLAKQIPSYPIVNHPHWKIANFIQRRPRITILFMTLA